MKSLLIFSHTERTGTLMLGFLSLAFLILPSFSAQFNAPKSTDFSVFKQEITQFIAQNRAKNEVLESKITLFDFNPNTATADDFITLGLPEPLANRICNYREKGGKFRQPADFSKIYGLSTVDFERLLPFIKVENDQVFAENFSEKAAKRPAENFVFDPNLATEHDFSRLGLSARTAKSILNYREKGGVFRKKSDFAKIYNLEEADFARLEPLIKLPEKPTFAANASTPVTYSTEYKPITNPSFGKPKLGANAKIDINSAAPEDWKQVPGIGQVFSQKITNFREKLGGFYKIEQVAETRGLPDSTFLKILPFLKLESPIYRKLNVNTASVEQFLAHPYFDKKIAETVIAYRDNHGVFKKVEDLRAMKAIRATWFEQIFPYLSVN